MQRIFVESALLGCSPRLSIPHHLFGTYFPSVNHGALPVPSKGLACFGKQGLGWGLVHAAKPPKR